jgi:hypothetical protein
MRFFPHNDLTGGHRGLPQWGRPRPLIKIILNATTYLINTLMKGIICPCGLKKFMGSKLFMHFMITYFYLRMSTTSYICLFITSKRFCCEKRCAERPHAFSHAIFRSHCDVTPPCMPTRRAHAQRHGARTTWLLAAHETLHDAHIFFFFFVPATPTITFFSQLPWRDTFYPYNGVQPLGIKFPFGTAIT